MHRRSAWAAAALAVLVPLSGAPALAATSDDPPPSSDGPTAPPAPASWGWIAGQGGVLKKGCHDYTYSYAINPPQGRWAIEVWIYGPDGASVANGAFLDGYDPLSGTGTYRVCSTSGSGQYEVLAKVSVDNDQFDPGTDGYVEGMLPASTYDLLKVPKHKHRKRHRHHRAAHR